MHDEAHRNEVHLVGRLAAPAIARPLPNGDSRVTWRLVVRRPHGRAAPGSPVDTVDCGTWEAPVKETVLAWAPGSLVEVRGSLRRRFWRSGGSVLSRYEVDVSEARDVAPAAVPADARTGPTSPSPTSASQVSS